MNDEPVAAVWRDDFLVGNESIDAQHMELFKMINEFHTGIRTDGLMARVFFVKMIQRSMQYIKSHITTEEDFMQRGEYPLFEEHKKLHDDFIAEVTRRVHNIETEGNPDPTDIVQYLTNWIIHHIADSDKKFAPYIAHLR